MIKLRMELQTFDCGIFMVAASPFTRGILPHDPRTSCPMTWGDLPLTPGRVRQDASLTIISEITLHKHVKMSQVRYHICAGKAGNVGQKNTR